MGAVLLENVITRRYVPDSQPTLSESVQVKILYVSLTRRKSPRFDNVYHVEFISEAKLLGRYLLQSLIVSHSAHVEAIFRLPINRRNKL